MHLQEHASLREYNTLRLSSTVRWLACPDSEVELISLLQDKRFSDLPRYVIGGGSNLLLADDLDALVIQPGIRGVKFLDESAKETLIEAGAGENWDSFVAHCLERGWFGLENLSLIPGTVGAAPYQNIGAYGVELSDCFDSLTAVNLKTAEQRSFSSSQCRFGYRDSYFKSTEPGAWVITRVRLRLSTLSEPVLGYADLAEQFARLPAERQNALGVRELICTMRRAKLPDPARLPNAGSFFKNPVVDKTVCKALKERYPGLVSYAQDDGSFKLAAGWLIDQAGWKGRSIGPVGMHERQALVLVNHGDAVFEDVQRVADAVCKDVFDRYGVQLEREPVMLP